MKIITTQLLGSLLLLFFSASCSRPAAYFQATLREHPVSTVPQTNSINRPLTPVVQTPTEEINPAQQLTQASAAFDEFDALVKNDSKLSVNKTVQKRMSRVRALLVSTSAKANLAPMETVAHRKATFMERVVLKKMNKKISRQLAPANPERTLVSKSILALSVILVLGGILLLALTTGGGFALGSIAIAAGLVILLIELL